MMRAYSVVIHFVAPYVGAWIETFTPHSNSRANQVAPYVGAWIETQTMRMPTNSKIKSHPTWVRGLKLLLVLKTPPGSRVAPYVGAWIETQ